MLDRIYIPTYRRPKTQITWNHLPDKYRAITKLIVDQQDYEALIAEGIPESNLILCPVQGTGIAKVRAWLAYQARGERYFVFDDDLKFYRKKMDPKTQKFTSHKIIDVNEFDEIFKFAHDAMEEGYVFGSLRASWNIPNPGYFPYAHNIKIMTNVFYDGRKLPWESIEWDRVEFAEDFDVALQLHSLGFESRTSQEFVVSPLPTNAPGGCSSQRTLERHNASQQKLHDLWPKYVKLKTKTTDTGPWAGQEKLSTIIYFGRCVKDFKDSQENVSLESFM